MPRRYLATLIYFVSFKFDIRSSSVSQMGRHLLTLYQRAVKPCCTSRRVTAHSLLHTPPPLTQMHRGRGEKIRPLARDVPIHCYNLASVIGFDERISAQPTMFLTVNIWPVGKHVSDLTAHATYHTVMSTHVAQRTQFSFCNCMKWRKHSDL